MKNFIEVGASSIRFSVNKLPENNVGLQRLLAELLDNGQAFQIGQYIELLHEDVANLSNDERTTLELPKVFDKTIYCEGKGQLNEEQFQFNVTFRDYVDGQDLNGIISGSILKTTNEEYCLNSAQYRFLAKVSEHDNSQERGANLNYRSLSLLKKLLEDSPNESIVFDSYLTSENTLLVDQFNISMDTNEDGSLHVSAAVEQAPWFDEKFNKFPSVRKMYTTQDENGERIRIPLNVRETETLYEVKKLKRVEPEDVPAFIEHPEEFIDPGVINLDDFSDRVMELGLYQPKYYPFVSKYKSDWIPGILIEGCGGERTKLLIETEGELEEVATLIAEAKSTRKEKVSWKGHDIPVERMEESIQVARKQFDDQSRPVEATKSIDKRVLIIHENVEDLTFGGSPASTDTFEHVFEEIPGLDKKYKLFPHQTEGIAWMQTAVRQKLTGVLLADDMGLGKTLQILSLIQWHNEKINEARKPYLVIAPVSLLENWNQEFKNYFPVSQLYIDEVHGSSARNISKNLLSENAIYMTTYETLRRKQKAFCAVDWAVVVMDEAQKVKTPGTLVTNAVKALKVDFMVPMTGTPVENSLMDMWCIIDACAPGLLGSASEFSKKYQKPLEADDTDVAALGDDLRRSIGIYIKRRLKADELEGLPRKEEVRNHKSMPVLQASRYREVLGDYQSAKESPDFGRGTILKLLQAMRETCDHPNLFDNSYELMSADALLQSCAKLQVTFDLLKHVKAKNEKALIFCHSKKAQRMLGQFFQDMFELPSVSIINGDTPTSSSGKDRSKVTRQGAIDRFQEVSGFNLIVMSPLAAGFGFNITEANHVIHYTRHWNPAKECQATDRAYRIGQKNTVYVYYPMSTSEEYRTFDVVLDDLLERKYELATASLFPSERAEVRQSDLVNALFE